MAMNKTVENNGKKPLTNTKNLEPCCIRGSGGGNR